MIIMTESAMDDNRTSLSPPSPDLTKSAGPSPTPTITAVRRPWYRRTLSGILWLAVDQWFLIMVGVLVAFASQVQVPARHQDLKNDIVNFLCVGLIFGITGLTLPTRVLAKNASRIWVHLFVQVFCFLLDSATVFGVVALIGMNHHFMDSALMIGLVYMGCISTTISSNVGAL
jgi:solute carrier family 10 (sodium/bile acid cotransporter), member 7